MPWDVVGGEVQYEEARTFFFVAWQWKRRPNDGGSLHGAASQRQDMQRGLIQYRFIIRYKHAHDLVKSSISSFRQHICPALYLILCYV